MDLKDAIVKYYKDSRFPNPNVTRYLPENEDMEHQLIPIFPIEKSDKILDVVPKPVVEEEKLIDKPIPDSTPKKTKRIYKQSRKRKANPIKKPKSKKRVISHNF